jgi:hypothetical protein
MPLLASPFGFECLDPFPDKRPGMNATHQKGHIGMAAFAASAVIVAS